MTPSSGRELAHRVFASLREQSGITEIVNSGFVSGVEHDGIIVGSSKPGVTSRVFLEIKSQPVIDNRVASIVLEKFSRLQESEEQPGAKYLLIYTGSITAGARQVLDGSNVIARSLRSLEDLGTDFWRTLRPDYEEPGPVGRAQQLIEALDDVPLGARYSVDYEAACESILEFLFSPDLGSPKAQVFNSTRSYRRDLIMKNGAETGFWARMRERYQADYLIAEFKNVKSSVGNTSIWQLAGYMKEKGVGFFGMLIARNGVSRGTANPAILDQWIHANKMIVPISNEDLKRMIDMRDSGSDPTDYVDDLIDRIRCSV